MKTKDIRKMGQAYLQVLEAAKPDFLDLDKDGNKKEPMKKAAADAKAKKQKKDDGNTEVDVQEAGPKLRPDSLKVMRAHDKAMKPEKEKPMTSTQKALAQVRQKAMGESVQEENISEMVKPSNTANPAAHKKAAAYHLGQANDHKEALKKPGMETSYYNDHKAAHKAHMAAADSHTGAMRVHKMAGAGDQNRIMDRTVMANKKSEAAKSATQTANESVIYEVSKKTLGSYIKKAAHDSAARAYDAGDLRDPKKAGAQIVKSISREKGIKRAVDKLMKKEADDDTVRMYKDNPDMMKKGGPGGLKGLNKSAQRDVKKAVRKESFNIEEKATAQHEPDDATRDTYEKQLKTRKGEKDFKDKHKMEVPKGADEPKIDAMNFQTFKNMVKNKDNSRSADQKIGDKSPVKNDGK